MGFEIREMKKSDKETAAADRHRGRDTSRNFQGRQTELSRLRSLFLAQEKNHDQYICWNKLQSLFNS